MKRAVAWLLTLCLVLTAIPLNVMAAETEIEPSQDKTFFALHDDQATRKAISAYTDDTFIDGHSDEQILGNQYIQFCVADTDGNENSGRFTIGNVAGNPNYESDNNKILMFGHPDPWSSYTTVRIDGNDYIFQATETEYNRTAHTAVSRMVIDQVEVIQTVKIIANTGTHLNDTVQISYSAKNLSSASKHIGVRIMLDTMLGSNDGAPFKVPSLGSVTQERELYGDAIPAYWQAFDNLEEPEVFAVGTLYDEDSRKPDKVQFAAWGDIYSSDNRWNYRIDRNQSVTGDSAVAIYWNPQAVASGQETVVSTKYGVGYAGTGDAAVTPVEVPSNGFVVSVLDQSGAPIEGATVSVTAQGLSSTTAPTNSDGYALFNRAPGKGNKATITVSKNGYLEMASKDIEIEPGSLIPLGLQKEDGQIHITGVTATLNGTDIDLLNTSLYLKSEPEGVQEAADASNVKKLSIKVTKTGEQGVIHKYQLIQGGKVVFESASATMDLTLLTGTPENPTKFGSDIRVKKLSAGKSVYLRLVDENGNTSIQQRLGLKISTPSNYRDKPDDGKLELGKEMKITVPDDIPLLGGSELEFGWDSPLFPLAVKVEDNGKVRVSLNSKNLTPNAANAFVAGEELTDWDDIKEDFEKAVMAARSKSYADAEKFGGKPSAFWTGMGKVSVNVSGYGEGYIDDNGNVMVTLGIVITGTGSYEWTRNTVVFYVPAYLSFGLEAKVTATGSTSIAKSNGRWKSTGNSLLLEFVPGGTVGGGLGTKGILSAGIAGKVTIPVKWGITEGNINVGLNGKVYAEATAFLLSWKSKPIFDETITIYDNFTGPSGGSAGGGGSGGGFSLEPETSLYDSSAYTPADRSYLYAPMALADEPGTVANNIYPHAAPKLVNVGGTNYMFWLQDVPGRADNDRTALVYSTSSDLETWTAPAQVLVGDTTADYAYDLCVEGNVVHILLNKANKVHGDGELNLDDIAKCAEMHYVKMDTGTGDIVQVQLTNDSSADILPSITVTSGGKALIAFAANSMNAGFFGQSTYTLKYAEIPANVVTGDTVSVSSASVGSAIITEVAAGKFGNDDIIAYILDRDGDYNTDSDRTLYQMKPDTAGAAVSDEGNVFSPSFAALGSTDHAILWYEDGNIQYKTTTTSESKKMFQDDAVPVGLTNAFYVLDNTSGSSSVVWTATGDDEKVVIYGANYTGSDWSAASPLYVTESEMSYTLTGYQDSSKPVIGYLERTGITEESVGTTTLKVVSPQSTPDIELLGVDFDPAQVQPGQPLDLTLRVRNNGSTSVNAMTWTVNDEASSSETVSISAGETKEVQVQYTVPSTLNESGEYTVKVDCTGDLISTNNNIAISIGFTDVSVKTEGAFVSGRDYAVVTVRNESAIATDVVLRLFADSMDGAVLYEKSFTNLSSAEAQALLIDLDALGYGAGTSQIYAQVIPSKEDGNPLDNADLLYLGAGRDVKFNLGVYAQTGGTANVEASGQYYDEEIIEITAEANPGYTFIGWEAAAGTFGNASAPVTTFTMPAQDVTIHAKFRENNSGSGGGGYYPPTVSYYNIKIDPSAHGTITSNYTSLYDGGTVTLTAAPDEGYKLNKITITDSQGNNVVLTETNGKYTFKMPNRNVTVTAEFVLEQTSTPQPWKNPFPDVSDTAWYIKAVEYVATEGLMSGYPSGKFGPNDNISRAEFAQIIYNKAGRPNAGSSMFTDVKTGQWYTNAVTWAAEQKVVSGIGNNQFAPNRDISREELATMLWRYAGSPNPVKTSLNFTDAGKVSNFAKKAMLWANENGIVAGKGNGVLDPKGKATRAETAQMLMNYLKK